MASGRDADSEVVASLESARATLGIPYFASRDEARRAYRALARAFHPDKGGDVNKFREVRKAHERLEAAWNASAVRHPRDGSAADPVASPETKRDDGSRRDAPAPPANTGLSPVAPTRPLEALAEEAIDVGDYARARDILDAVIARALADELDGRESPSPEGGDEKKKTGGTLAEAFLSRARACAGIGDWSAALLDADGALARRGLWLEPHVVRAEALERLGRHREAEESYARCVAASDGEDDTESGEDGEASSSSAASSGDSSETSDDNADDDDDAEDVDGFVVVDDDDDERDTMPRLDGDDAADRRVDAPPGNAFDERSATETVPSSADKKKPKTSAASARSAVASEGSRRCRASAAERTAVFETRGSSSGAAIVAVAFAPRHETFPANEALLAAADALGAVSIWSAPSGRLSFRLRASSEDEHREHREHRTRASSTAPSSIATLRWGPLGNDGELRLVATTGRGDATLWRFSFGRVANASPEAPTPLRLVATHGLVVAPQRDERTSREAREARTPVGPAVAAFAHAAALVGVGDASGRLRVFDARDGSPRRVSRRAHRAAVTCVAFHPRQSWQVTTGGADGDGRAWDLEGLSGGKPGRCQHTFRWRGPEGHPSRNEVTDAAYAPCGRLVVLATADPLGNSGAGSYRLLVWSAVTGRLCTWHDAHAAPVTSWAWERAFETAEPRAAGADAPAEPRETQREKQRLEKQRRAALEENVVVTACEDGALRLWALRGAPQGAGKPLHECWAYAAGNGGRWSKNGLGDPCVARGAASCVARSPGGGGLLATAHVDGTVRVLDASSFHVLEAWSLGSAQRACAWAPAGVLSGGGGEALGGSERADASPGAETRHLLASGGRDGTVRVWCVETDARLDAVSWRDPDEGVVAAIGPGDVGRSRALPASTLVGVSGERVSLALEAFGGENSTRASGGVAGRANAPFSMFDHGRRANGASMLPAAGPTDGTPATAGDRTLAVTVADGARDDAARAAPRRPTPEDARGLPAAALAFAFGDAAAAEAERRLEAWREKLAESESATRAASAARRAFVRERFPGMTPEQRRAYNAAYAERMAPLRAIRARFWNLVRSHGYEADEADEADEGTSTERVRATT